MNRPPEHADHYSEKLALMPPCYIANDYAQTQGAVLDHNSLSGYRAPRAELLTDFDILDAANVPILFGTLSNSQKVDRSMFQVWMNILNRFAGSKLVFMDYLGSSFAMPNLRSYSLAHGVNSSRLPTAPQVIRTHGMSVACYRDLFSFSNE
jgi:predicted O-linked N-acetylglucosamine transferase (SPINDLY family)